MSLARNPRWYADGLAFSCTGCGDCCRGEGWVWVARAEIRAIARFLGLDPERFGQRYLRRIGRRVSLVEKPDHDCVFFDGSCSIYPVRPRQCRTYPFWNVCVAEEESWERTVGECEGAGCGRRYEAEEIDRLRSGQSETAPSEEER